MGQFNDQLRMSAPALYDKDDDDKKKKKNTESAGSLVGAEVGVNPLGKLQRSIVKKTGTTTRYLTKTMQKKAPADTTTPPKGTSPLGELGMSGNATERFSDEMVKVNPKYQKRVNKILGRK